MQVKLRVLLLAIKTVRNAKKQIERNTARGPPVLIPEPYVLILEQPNLLLPPLRSGRRPHGIGRVHLHMRQGGKTCSIIYTTPAPQQHVISATNRGQGEGGGQERR